MLLYVPCIVYYNNLWHVRWRKRQWVSGCDSVWSTNRVWSCLQRCSALQLASLGVRGRSWHYPYSSIREVIDISAEPLKFQLKSGGIQEPASAIVCVWNYLQVISHVFSQMLFQFKEARTRPLLHLVTQFPSNHKKKPRGWFGTLVIFPYLGNNNTNWLSYFSEGVETTNQ